jgi:hypothetical protein
MFGRVVMEDILWAIQASITTIIITMKLVRRTEITIIQEVASLLVQQDQCHPLLGRSALELVAQIHMREVVPVYFRGVGEGPRMAN